jgi:hypothetical protein
MPGCRWAVAGVAALLSAVVLVVCQVQAAGALTTGTAYIVNAQTEELVGGGGSSTTFALGLPKLARCPGDSTVRPWYRAYTYLVPKGNSPTEVNFKTGEPDRWYGLYSSGTAVEAVNVLKGSGLVSPVLPGNLAFPSLQLAPLFPAGAQAATWEAGVACTTYQGNVVAYWNVEVQLAQSTSDRGGFTWTVAQHPPSSRGSDLGFKVVGFGAAVLLGVAAVAVGMGGRRGRRARSRGGDAVA